MTRNVALFSRRELAVHRQFTTGVTASIPRYQEVDTAATKEFVVDVYLGPGGTVEPNVVKDVPIASYAKQLVTDIHQPVTLERSHEGKYTVIGRAKVMASGAQSPEASLDDPTYHLVEHNLADLGLLFVADLDWTFERYRESPTKKLQTQPTKRMQDIRAYDAFGNQVVGPEIDAGVQRPFQPQPVKATTTRHVVIRMAKYGPRGDPDAMVWGQGPYQPAIQRVVEQTT